MTEAIRLEGVSVKQLTLIDDKVLVRVVPREEVRASGLFVLHGSPEHQVGSEFYGEVVATGPGTLVREGPPADAVANVAMMAVLVHAPHENASELSTLVADAVRDFLARHKTMRRVPPDFKAGDRVLVKQGFGVELDLREGRHHVIERAGKFGHGILAAWDADHVHCWHFHDSSGVDGVVIARCSCGATKEIETRLPACAGCPPGERLAEAVLGGKHVYDVKVPDAPAAEVFDPEAPGFRVGEMRPE